MFFRYQRLTYFFETIVHKQGLKKALVQKELIDDTGTSIEFLDPAYERWFQKNM